MAVVVVSQAEDSRHTVGACIAGKETPQHRVPVMSVNCLHVFDLSVVDSLLTCASWPGMLAAQPTLYSCAAATKEHR
jgi:hypothetical protein